MGRHLLERERELAALTAAVQEGAGGSGSVVLVFGEAGIGKSCVVEAIRALLPDHGRLLIGYCDDLTTSRVLGPFRDLVGRVGAELAGAVRDSNDRDRVMAALRGELDWAQRPTVLAVEDVHWADDATLDVLRYLVRRIGSLPAVLVLTYRDDELTRDNPLHELLGLASGAERLRRLPLARLSEDAVRRLGEGSGVDAGHLFSLTAGNPFFVHAVLAAGEDEPVPSTIVDALMSRVRRLDLATRHTVEQLSVVPSALEPWLIEALVPDGVPGLAPAEEHGLLAVSPSTVSFRHELSRRAIADSLPAARRIELNRRVLAALLGSDAPDLSRLVHHATEAGDVEAIARYAPAAAREAARAGAHREAAAHFRLVLARRGGFSRAEQAGLLEGYAVECYTLGAAQDAVDTQSEAVALRRQLGDPVALGATLRWLSRMHWWNGDRDRAESVAVEAIDVLEDAGDARLLALALSNQSQLHMLVQHTAESIRIGERAAVLAREVGDAAILSHALTNIGSSHWFAGSPRGLATMGEGLQVALSAGETEHALRAYVAISSSLLDEARLGEAEASLAAGITLAHDSEQVAFLGFLTLERARLNLERAAWDDVRRDAESALHAQPPMRWAALLALGRMRVRLGQQGGEQLLRQAWSLSLEMQELQRTGPIAAGLAEAAWLRGDHAAMHEIVEPVHAVARSLGAVRQEPELAYWLTKAGCEVDPIESDHPYALQARGRWRAAADAWRAAGAPYEHAAALAESDGPNDLLSALAELDALGAVPLARLVRGRLRSLGAGHLPRGPAATTRRNPAGLTGRQVDVLRLLGQGFTNTEIADRLVLSVRTVDSHVAAVLSKLGTHTRRDAVARATELGVRFDDQ